MRTFKQRNREKRRVRTLLYEPHSASLRDVSSMVSHILHCWEILTITVSGVTMGAINHLDIAGTCGRVPFSTWYFSATRVVVSACISGGWGRSDLICITTLFVAWVTHLIVCGSKGRIAVTIGLTDVCKVGTAAILTVAIFDASDAINSTTVCYR